MSAETSESGIRTGSRHEEITYVTKLCVICVSIDQPLQAAVGHNCTCLRDDRVRPKA